VYGEDELKRRQQDIIDREVLRSRGQSQHEAQQTPPPEPSYSRLTQSSRDDEPSSASVRSNVISAASRQSAALRSLESQYTVVQMKRVGQLSGKNIVYDISKLTEEDINRFYEMDPDYNREQQAVEVNFYLN
jgi:hypothetical protein